MRKATLLLVKMYFFAFSSFSQQKVFSCDYTGLIYERFSTRIVSHKEKDFFIVSMVNVRFVEKFICEGQKNTPLLEDWSLSKSTNVTTTLDTLPNQKNAGTILENSSFFIMKNEDYFLGYYSKISKKIEVYKYNGDH